MKFYGQLELDKIIYERYFLNKSQGTYLECGAFDGIIDSNTLFFNKFLNWNGYNVEPLPNIYTHLCNNRKEDVNLNLALSDIDDNCTFTQAIDKNVPFYHGHFGNGSLRHTPAHLDELMMRGCEFENFTVRTITLQTLFLEQSINKQIDFFSLDVEGHEGKVLSQLHKIDSSLFPKIIAVEYGHCGQDQILEHLVPLGYILDYRDDINLVFRLEIK